VGSFLKKWARNEAFVVYTFHSNIQNYNVCIAMKSTAMLLYRYLVLETWHPCIIPRIAPTRDSNSRSRQCVPKYFGPAVYKF
jgi:hypothetical protein